MVVSRWAIVKVVRPLASFSKDCCTSRSLSLSKAEVASSQDHDGRILEKGPGEC